MNYTYYHRYQPSRRKNGSFKSFFWLVTFLVVILLVLRACVSMAASLLEEKKDEAVLTVYKGEAEVLEWGQTEAEKASDAQLILEGDQVQTQSDAWAILTFYNGTAIKLDQNTKVVLSKVETDQENEQAYVQLLEGRLWVDHSLEDDSLDIQIDTDLMVVQSVQGQYLLSHLDVGEAVYVQNGPVTVEYMDRSDEGSVIETVVMKGGEMSILDPDKQTALLARENVTLVETVGEGMFTDSFIKWCEGVSMESTETEVLPVPDEDSPAEEETPEETAEPVASFTIRIDSPATGSTIPKDAIALEGSIVSGTASKVTVTWNGSGQPYTLSGFQPGGSTFRYVADVDYGNYAKGQNTYTIVAYDAEGKASNTVTIVLNAEF